MSQSYDDAGDGAVFEGFWVDHDRGGSIQGATLTLRARPALVLLAFFAVLVTFAAIRSWLFWRFLLHIFISRKTNTGPTPALARHEVILRNVITPSGALWSLLTTNSPKPSTRKDSQRGFLLGLFTAGHVLVFAAASILTSQVTIGQTVVSRAIETCGQWTSTFDGTGPVVDDAYYLYLELGRNATIDADNYVQNCHSNQAASRQIMSCNKLLTRELVFVTESSTECPFQDDVCLTGNRSLVMDSGNISSADLGINSKFARTLTVRRRSICAPLDADRFRSPPPPAVADNAQIDFSAFSFLAKNGTPYGAPFLLRHPKVSLDYDLQAYEMTVSPEAAADGADLVPSLKRGQDNRTVSIILLSGTGLLFLSSNNDPFFSANRRTQTSRFRMDKNATMIGCDERAQLCSSLTGRCTKWDSLPPSFPDALSVLGGEVAGDDAMDIMRFIGLLQVFLETTLLPRSIGDRTAAAALRAGRYLNSGWQIRIEPEQWKREPEYWFAVGLARLQLEIFGTVEKPPGVDARKAVNRWDEEKFRALKALCGGIKFRSPGHTSLSTLGFGLILGLSGVLILLSFADTVVPWLLRKFGYEFRDWEQTDMLKLLERTLEIERGSEGVVADTVVVTGPDKGNV